MVLVECLRQFPPRTGNKTEGEGSASGSPGEYDRGVGRPTMSTVADLIDRAQTQ